jgi:hypothetical protein
MPSYSAFGGCLVSDIEILDLPRSTCTGADWRMVAREGGPPDVGAEQLGEHMLGRWGYRLYRFDGGIRLEYAVDYVFDLLGDGSEIVWYPREDSSGEILRALLLGPVLALAHHMSGALTLHGSAVAIEGEGVGFLAAKFHGKSTLALALTLSGARHLSDDALVVDPDPPARVRPGVHSFRLWDDSAGRLGAADLECLIVEGEKNTLTELPPRLLQETPVPLGALYLLSPVAPVDGEPAAYRRRLPAVAASVALSHHAKLPQPLIGVEGSAPQFLRAATIARSVPIYELCVMRDFDRLPEVVELLLGWHSAANRDSTAAARASA